LRKSSDKGPIPRRLRFGAPQESDFQPLGKNTTRFNPAGNRSKSLGRSFPSILSRNLYLIAEAISTAKGPLGFVSPRNFAAWSGEHGFPAFCSSIAVGIRSARSTAWRGYFARVDALVSRRSRRGRLAVLAIVAPPSTASHRAPQVSHFKHVPLRTMVKLPHSGHAARKRVSHSLSLFKPISRKFYCKNVEAAQLHPGVDRRAV
jgi:hypothetical protein